MLTGFTVFQELWVFPLHQAFLAWALFTALYCLSKSAAFRCAVCIGGAGLSCVYTGLPMAGAFAVLFPFLVWKLQGRWLLVFLPALLWAAFYGHFPAAVNPGMLIDGRLSIHILTIFFFFRFISFGIATAFRHETATLTDTIEYFYAPPFLLEPGKGFLLTFAKFREPLRSGSRRRGVVWVFYGVILHLLYTVFGGALIHSLGTHFSLGNDPWNIRWLAEVGLATFLLAFMEKARMSFFLAGFLRLSGREVEPDFNSPWLARNLLDYWRRFHYWVLEFYIESIYQPASYYLSRYFGARVSVGIALFLTFSFGTTLSHWIHYQASFTITFLLGLIFGLVTVAHYFGGILLKPFTKQWGWLGYPVTWISVSFLYALAYPAFGLGWSFGDILGFFW